VPPLRFPGFSDEWETYSINEISNIVKGSGISKEQLSKEGEECILYGELYTKYKSEIIDEVFSKTDINSTKLTRSQHNDVIIPCSGESAEDIATARCVTRDGILLGGDLNIIRFNGQNGAFMSYQLNGKRKYDIARVTQGVSVVHLYPDHLKSVKVSTPSLKEQNRIVKLLSLIDKRISTQNKIIEDLKKLKSAIIETEILHNTEADIIQLSNICNEAKQIKEEKPTYERIITVRLHAKGVCRSTAENLELGATQYYIRNSGQLIYGKQNFHNGAIGLIPDTLDKGLTSKDIPSFDINSNICNPTYLLYQLQHPSFYEPVEAFTTGSGSKRLKEKDFLSLQIKLPSKDKQDKIAYSITKISDKIEFENQILTLFQKQCQYLLSQMFI